MVTIVDLGETTLKSGIVEVRCLSTDVKPTTGIKNGSTCIEINTANVYMFNGATSTWDLIPD